MNHTLANATRSRWILGVLLLLCAVIYAPGLSGGFLFDDMPNIVENPILNSASDSAPNWLAVALFSGSGPLRRPISMLSFGLNIRAFGMDASAFKAVNLGIHLLCGLLLYVLARRLALRLLAGKISNRAADYVALICASWWLLHPLHVSTVLYVVQRMTQLSALFTLAGLLCYVAGRSRSLEGKDGLISGVIGLGFFGLLAVLSKENGALIIFYALVIEATCFGFAGPPVTRRGLQFFFLVAAVLPTIAGVFYLVTRLGILSYNRNGFTFYTHLLSDARVLCDYLAWTFLPLPAWLGMFHDDIAVSTSLFSPVSTIISIAVLIALVLVAWRLRRRCPAVTFGVAWFLAGLSMEQGIIPVELVFEHRNYLPSAGLLLGVCCVVAPWLTKYSRQVVIAACVCALLLVAGLTLSRTTAWASPLSLALADAHHHPNSSRSQYQAGREIVFASGLQGQNEKTAQEALPYFDRAALLNPLDVYSASARILMQPASTPIPEEKVQDLAYRLRNAQSGEQINPFFEVLISASLGRIALKPDDASTLLDGALSNPRWRPTARAMVMNNYGAYLFNIVNDRQGAIQATLAATEEDPKNPYYVLNAAKIAIAVGDRGRATEYLKKASELDKAHVQTKSIDEVTKQIEAMAQAGQETGSTPSHN